MKVLGWLTPLCEKIIFFPRVLIYTNTFIQGQYVYNINFNISCFYLYLITVV
jgi:hypothetical protein